MPTDKERMDFLDSHSHSHHQMDGYIEYVWCDDDGKMHTAMGDDHRRAIDKSIAAMKAAAKRGKR